ncbi:hypothetical protein, partial [Burkholderia pseudomallei]|uniref:hypothetical protein n=1 Tax=Burkholderia pseudomallei TaxID=28450 RepID=UPI002930D2BA
MIEYMTVSQHPFRSAAVGRASRGRADLGPAPGLPPQARPRGSARCRGAPLRAASGGVGRR